jgi:hypothetical protein
MLIRRLVVVGLVGFISFAANIATAEDAGAPSIAINGVSFLDPTGDITPTRLNLQLGAGESNRFAGFAPTGSFTDSGDEDRNYELSVTTRAAGDVDVSFAQRGGVGFNDQGDIERESSATELRLGRGLGMRSEEYAREPRWYFFAASEDEALTWGPGSTRNAFGGTGGGSFGLQDTVEIGDLQAGVTYQVGRVQTSLAYVEREISVTQGSRTFRQDESFAGLTVTMRR